MLTYAADIGEGLVLYDVHLPKAGEFEHCQEGSDDRVQARTGFEKFGKEELFLIPEAEENKLHAVGNRDLLSVDFAFRDALGKAAQNEIKGIPEFNPVDRLEGSLNGFQGIAGSKAGELFVTVENESFNFSGGLFEFFVLEELLNQFPARINRLILYIFIGALIFFGQEEPTLDIHEGRRHDKEFAGDFEVEFLHRPEDFNILPGDGLNRDVVDVDLIAANQVEQ